MTDLPIGAQPINSDTSTSSWVTHLARLVPALAGSVLTVGTIIGFALHFAGEVAHATYLTDMGLQSTSFPQSTDWKTIHGLFVVLTQGAWLAEDVPLGRIAVALVFVVIPFVIAGAPTKRNERLRNWLMGVPYWIRQPFVVYFLSTSILFIATAVGTVLLLSSTVPGIIGERYGVSEAKAHLERLQRGEFKAISQLWKDGGKLMQGEIIITSAELIALYDVERRPPEIE